MIKSILTALGIFALIMSAAYLDAPLSTEARTTLASVPDRTTHRAALYRAGLNAPEGVDPSLYGRYVLLGAQAQGHPPASRALPSIDSQRLRIPRGPWFCSIFEDPDCWLRIHTMDASVLSRLETENATLLSRYQTWLHISDAENKSIGLTPENSVPTEHLSGAHRLMILRAFDDAAKGQVAAASQRLYRMISDLRRHLALADDFAAKLILADLMDESLQAVSVISHTHRIKLPPLRPLTPEEKDLSPAIARQFRKAYDFFLSVDAMRSRGDDGPPDSATQRSRMQRFIYKPNHAINRTHQVMSFWMEAARGTPSEFARLMSQQVSRNQALILWDHLRNPLGRTLSQLAEPNFKTQIVRLQRLDIMIAMFNATQEHALEDIPPEALASPYGLGGLAAPSPNRSTLCMPSPDIIDANPTCLHLGR